MQTCANKQEAKHFVSCERFIWVHCLFAKHKTTQRVYSNVFPSILDNWIVAFWQTSQHIFVRFQTSISETSTFKGAHVCIKKQTSWYIQTSHMNLFPSQTICSLLLFLCTANWKQNTIPNILSTKNDIKQTKKEQIIALLDKYVYSCLLIN